MKKIGLYLCALAVAVMCSAGCARTAYVDTEPPPPKVETKPAAPGPRAVWIDGHWKWNGRRYVWAGGHWERNPKGTWVPGHWVKKPRGHVWVPGHWQH